MTAPTSAQMEAALKMYQEGVPVREILTAQKVGKAVFYRALRAQEITLRGRGGARRGRRGPDSVSKGPKRKKEEETLNVRQIQNMVGQEFVKAANRILRGEIYFKV